MHVTDLSAISRTPIQEYDSVNVQAAAVLSGRGTGHVYALHFEAGSVIGRHTAGFEQLFLVIQGKGWISGADGKRHTLQAGQLARVQKGEEHAKGSESGMEAIMIQISEVSA